MKNFWVVHSTVSQSRVNSFIKLLRKCDLVSNTGSLNIFTCFKIHTSHVTILLMYIPIWKYVYVHTCVWERGRVCLTAVFFFLSKMKNQNRTVIFTNPRNVCEEEKKFSDKQIPGKTDSIFLVMKFQTHTVWTNLLTVNMISKNCVDHASSCSSVGGLRLKVTRAEVYLQPPLLDEWHSWL